MWPRIQSPSSKPEERKLFKRFARDKKGMAAVEFALVSIPFIGLLFAIIETAVVLFAGQVLENAVADASRLIMTGQAQSTGMTQAQFKTEICNRLSGLFDCSGGVYVDVKTYATFGTASQSKPVNGSNQLDTSSFGYTPGTGGSIVVVRAVYQWPIFISRLGYSMGDLSNGKKLLVATAAFRNEPF